MRTLEQLQARIEGYEGLNYIWDQYLGYIVWHLSTGDNIEVLFIEANVLGGGYYLCEQMVQRILEKGPRPYHSVFAYTLGCNEQAQRFYEKLGFNILPLGRSIYQGDETVLVWITWAALRDYFTKRRT
jgi:hypothetical protein